MSELLDKLVTAIVGQSNSGIVSVLLICVGYLAWTSYQTKKEHKEEVAQYRQTIATLQASLNDKTGEEREMLLSIIDKYHQSQISIREAISEVKTVLATLSIINRGG